jgi:DNA-binding NtrC family response regulator
MGSEPVPQVSVLLVDDEETVLASMTRTLKAAGIAGLLGCPDPRRVMGLLESAPVDVVLLDLAMPHLRGEELLPRIRERFPQVAVIVVTASDDIDCAVRCMRGGAFDYMVKPVEAIRLTSGVRRALDLKRLARQYSTLRESVLADTAGHPDAYRRIVTRNHRMLAIFRFIDSIAPTPETVLLSGETGTGKELFAEAIHEASGRAGDLVRVNSAGLDDTVFADTLFGHGRGAFTGAEAVRRGLVQQADRGTLFLDEIGDLSAASQIKLLRLVETFEYYPLGADLPRVTTARFVVASSRDLPALVAGGQFRRDLFYRLQTHEVRIPALRERRDDLPLLLDHFLAQACGRLGRKRLAVPPELLTLLETWDFPGNVRELRSMIFNAVSRQGERTLSLETFREAMGRAGPELRPPSSAAELVFPDRLPTLRQAADRLVAEALARAKGNQAIAAGLLGISPQALSKRLSRRGGAGGTPRP